MVGYIWRQPSWECCPFYVGLTHNNVNPHRSYCHSAGNLFRACNISSAGKFSCAGRFFRAGRIFRAETPYLLRNIRICSPGLHPARFPPSPLAFPWLLQNGWLFGYPERAGIPKLEGGCHSNLGSSADISISHSGVSRGHRNVPHASVNHYSTSPDSSGLRRPPNRTPLCSNDPFHYHPLLTRIS